MQQTAGAASEPSPAAAPAKEAEEYMECDANGLPVAFDEETRKARLMTGAVERWRPHVEHEAVLRQLVYVAVEGLPPSARRTRSVAEGRTYASRPARCASNVVIIVVSAL